LKLKLKLKLLLLLWLYSPLLGIDRFFSFLLLYTVGRTPWTGDWPISAHRTTQTRNKRTQTSMPLVEFEPTIPVFERTKTVRTLDRLATVIGFFLLYYLEILSQLLKFTNICLPSWNRTSCPRRNWEVRSISGYFIQRGPGSERNCQTRLTCTWRIFLYNGNRNVQLLDFSDLLYVILLPGSRTSCRNARQDGGCAGAW
jgi:hypothetical protein